MENKTYVGTYKVVRVFRKSTRRQVIRRNLSFEEARELVNRYPDRKNSMVVFFKQYWADRYFKPTK